MRRLNFGIKRWALTCILPATLAHGPLLTDLHAQNVPSASSKISAGQPIRKAKPSPTGANVKPAGQASAAAPKSNPPAKIKDSNIDLVANPVPPRGGQGQAQGQAGGESDVQRQLRMLYEKSGQEMPAMTLDELEVPEPQAGVQPGGAGSNIQQPGPQQQVRQAPAPQKVPNLFERVFLGKKMPPPTLPRSVPQRPPQRPPQPVTNGQSRFPIQYGPGNSNAAQQRPNYQPYQTGTTGQGAQNQPQPQGQVAYPTQQVQQNYQPQSEFIGQQGNGAVPQSAPSQQAAAPRTNSGEAEPPRINVPPQSRVTPPSAPPPVRTPNRGPDSAGLPALDDVPMLDDEADESLEIDLQPKGNRAANAPEAESAEATDATESADSAGVAPMMETEEVIVPDSSIVKEPVEPELTSPEATEPEPVEEPKAEELPAEPAEENPFSGLELSVPEPVKPATTPRTAPNRSAAANATVPPKTVEVIEEDPFQDDPPLLTPIPEPAAETRSNAPVNSVVRKPAAGANDGAPKLIAPKVDLEKTVAPASQGARNDTEFDPFADEPAVKAPVAKPVIAKPDTAKPPTPKPIATKPAVASPAAAKAEVNVPVGDKLKQLAAAPEKAGLKGFCPVILRQKRQLVAANAQFHVVHKGKTYHFSSAEARATFEKSPDLYAPAHGGQDAVALQDDEKPVVGTLDYSAWFQGRLYLFASRQNLETFNEDPEVYLDESDVEDLTIPASREEGIQVPKNRPSASPASITAPAFDDLPGFSSNLSDVRPIAPPPAVRAQPQPKPIPVKPQAEAPKTEKKAAPATVPAQGPMKSVVIEPRNSKPVQPSKAASPGKDTPKSITPRVVTPQGPSFGVIDSSKNNLQATPAALISVPAKPVGKQPAAPRLISPDIKLVPVSAEPTK